MNYEKLCTKCIQKSWKLCIISLNLQTKSNNKKVISMKKNVFFGIVASAVIVFSVFVLTKKQSAIMADNGLLLDNVEALTQGDEYPPQGFPLTNWKKYPYTCPPKVVTTTKVYKASAGAKIPAGATSYEVNGELYYEVTVTEKYTPIISICGSGSGGCLVSEKCN